MSDTTRAAADRLTRFARTAMRGTPSQAPAYWDAAHMEVYHGTPHTKLGDMLAVAESWLAEHPDSDAEPIDEACLRSLGFRSLRRDADEWCANPDDDTALVASPKGWYLTTSIGDSIGIKTPATKGEARALCRCLGIALTEPSTP